MEILHQHDKFPFDPFEDIWLSIFNDICSDVKKPPRSNFIIPSAPTDRDLSSVEIKRWKALHRAAIRICWSSGHVYVGSSLDIWVCFGRYIGDIHITIQNNKNKNLIAFIGVSTPPTEEHLDQIRQHLDRIDIF